MWMLSGNYSRKFRWGKGEALAKFSQIREEIYTPFWVSQVSNSISFDIKGWAALNLNQSMVFSSPATLYSSLYSKVIIFICCQDNFFHYFTHPFSYPLLSCVIK